RHAELAPGGDATNLARWRRPELAAQKKILQTADPGSRFAEDLPGSGARPEISVPKLSGLQADIAQLTSGATDVPAVDPVLHEFALEVVGSVFDQRDRKSTRLNSSHV